MGKRSVSSASAAASAFAFSIRAEAVSACGHGYLRGDASSVVHARINSTQILSFIMIVFLLVFLNVPIAF
jgi:hypothetical protein